MDYIQIMYCTVMLPGHLPGTAKRMCEKCLNHLFLSLIRWNQNVQLKTFQRYRNFLGQAFSVQKNLPH